MIEVPESGGDLEFVRDENDSGKTSMVINEGHKPTFFRGSSNLGQSPHTSKEVGLVCMVVRERRSGVVLPIHTSQDKVETLTLEKR